MKEAIFREFGLTSEDILSFKKCGYNEYKNDRKVIKKTFATANQIFLECEIKKKLIEQGFKFLFETNYSLNNNPFVIFDDNLYIMHDNVIETNANLENEIVFLELVKKTALIHKNLRNFNFSCTLNYENKIKIQELNLCEKFYQAKKIILNTKKKISSRKKNSDFDVLFLQTYNANLEIITSAINLLEKNNFKEYIINTYNNNHLKHNMLKSENVYILDEVIVENFTNSNVGIQLCDLCSLIKRKIKIYAKLNNISFNLNELETSILAIISEYSKVLFINKEELLLLKVLLMFPEKYVNVCKEYYDVRKNLVPTSIIKRMNEVIEIQKVEFLLFNRLNFY